MKTTNNNAARKTETVECPKCQGTGVVKWAKHVDGGMCYDCKGEGTIEIDALTPNEKLDMLTGSLRMTASIVLDAAIDDNTTRRDFYLALMVDDMFRIGTTRARKVLAYIRAGEFYGDSFERETIAVCPAPKAAACAAKLIELGRAKKAG